MKETVQKATDRVLLYSLPVAILGAVFKLEHWAGANQMLMVGVSSVAIGAFIRYSAEKTLEGYVTGFTIAITCIGVLFQILHFSGASWLIDIAIVSAVALAAIKLFFSKKSEESDDNRGGV